MKRETRTVSTRKMSADVGAFQFATHVRRDSCASRSTVFNLFDRQASGIDYCYASRLRGEPAGGVADIHSHPVEPRSLRLLADRELLGIR